MNPKRVRELIRRMGLQAIFLHKSSSFSLPGFNKKGYFFNNAEMLHQGLGYHMPYEIYFGHTASKKFIEPGNSND